jgi:hypothetical protein
VKTVKLRALLLMSVILSALSNGVITGTVTYSTSASGQQNPPFSGTISGSASTTFPVTRR